MDVPAETGMTSCERHHEIVCGIEEWILMFKELFMEEISSFDPFYTCGRLAIEAPKLWECEIHSKVIKELK